MTTETKQSETVSVKVGDKVTFYISTRWGRSPDRTGVIKEIKDGGEGKGGGFRYVIDEVGREIDVVVRPKNILSVIADAVKKGKKA